MLLTNKQREDQKRLEALCLRRINEAKTKARELQSSGYVQTSLARTLQKEKLARDGFYATTKPSKQYEHLKPRKKDSMTVVKPDGTVYDLIKKK